MAYKWEDLQSDHLEVEWADNIHRTRRARTMGVHDPAEKRGGGLTALLVCLSTLGAVGMAAIVATTLVKSPSLSPKREENPASAQGMDSLPESLPEVWPTALPTTLRTTLPSALPTTRQPTGLPTLRPTTVWPTESPVVSASALPSALPSVASSGYPSETPSSMPSGVPRAPPAPDPVPCVDRFGVFHNHAGDKVPCAWFSTVGTYNFEKNCERTEVGKACLLTCKEYNGCILITPPPSRRPSTFPPSSTPTASPTPEPPKSTTLGATGDTSIKEALPNANLGSSSWLKLDAAPLPMPQDSPSSRSDTGAFHVLLRFDLSRHDSTRPVESAALRLKAANSCSSGGHLERTHSPHWDENAVTWLTAPAGDGTEIGRLGVIKNGFWTSVDLPVAALHHGTLSLRLYPDASDHCLFVSKENPSGGGPELHITYDDV